MKGKRSLGFITRNDILKMSSRIKKAYLNAIDLQESIRATYGYEKFSFVDTFFLRLNAKGLYSMYKKWACVAILKLDHVQEVTREMLIHLLKALIIRTDYPNEFTPGVRSKRYISKKIRERRTDVIRE